MAKCTVDWTKVGQECGDVTTHRIEYTWAVSDLEKCIRTKYKRCLVSPEVIYAAEEYERISCRLLLFPRGSKDAKPDDTSLYLYIHLCEWTPSVFGRFVCWMTYSDEDDSATEITAEDSLHGCLRSGCIYGFHNFMKLKNLADGVKCQTVDRRKRIFIHFTLDFSMKYNLRRPKDSSPMIGVPLFDSDLEPRKMKLSDMMKNLSFEESTKTDEEPAQGSKS